MTIERLDMFRALAARRTDELVITTMTATLQWPLVSSHPLDFDFLAFGMGHASDFGLGLALARPERKVIVLKGDGGLLMSLGSLVTMGRYGPPNLLVLLLENRSYEMTGGQPLAPKADFVALAARRRSGEGEAYRRPERVRTRAAPPPHRTRSPLRCRTGYQRRAAAPGRPHRPCRKGGQPAPGARAGVMSRFSC